MPIRFNCVHCNCLLNVSESKQGGRVKCLNCDRELNVPAQIEEEEVNEEFEDEEVEDEEPEPAKPTPTYIGPIEKSQSPAMDILRWIAVLPAAIGAFFAVQLVVIIINRMTTERWSDWVIQLINSAVSAYFFVYAGAATSPKYQFIVSIVLAVIHGIFTVSVITARFFVKTSDPIWFLIIAGIIALVASIVAVVMVQEKHPIVNSKPRA